MLPAFTAGFVRGLRMDRFYPLSWHCTANFPDPHMRIGLLDAFFSLFMLLFLYFNFLLQKNAD